MIVSIIYLGDDLYELNVDQRQLYLTTDMDYRQKDSSSLVYFYKHNMYALFYNNPNDTNIITYNNRYYRKIDITYNNIIISTIRIVESKKILNG
jgi:hypothetical protein